MARRRRRAGRRAPARRGRARCARARGGPRRSRGRRGCREPASSSVSSALASCGRSWARRSRAAAANADAISCGSPLSRALATSSSACGCVLVRAALGEQAQLQGARLDEGDVAGRLQALGERLCLGQRLLRLAELGEEGRRLSLAIPSASSVMPRLSQKSTPSRHATRAACGPSYCQLTIARLLCRTAAARPWPCSSASASARRMSSSPCRSPREERATPRKPSARAGSGRPSSAARASACSAAAIASR